MARSHKNASSSGASRSAGESSQSVGKTPNGKVDKSVASKGDDWGYQPARGGMAIEAKLGMFIIMILVGAFGFLVYRRVDMHQQQLLAMNGSESAPAADLEDAEPFESPEQFVTEESNVAADMNFEDQFTEPTTAENDFEIADVGFAADVEPGSTGMDADPFTVDAAEQVAEEPNPFDPNVIPDVELTDNSQAVDDPFAGAFTDSEPDNSVAAVDDGLLFEEEASPEVPTIGFGEADVAVLDVEQSRDSFDGLELSNQHEEEVVLGSQETQLKAFADDADDGWQSAGSLEAEQQFVANNDGPAETVDALPGPAEESIELGPAPGSSGDTAFVPGNNPEAPSDDSFLSFDNSADNFAPSESEDVPDMTIAMLDDTTQGDFGGSLESSPFQNLDRPATDDQPDSDPPASDPLILSPTDPGVVVVNPQFDFSGVDSIPSLGDPSELIPVDHGEMPPEPVVVRDDAQFDARAFAYENRVVPASSESEPCDVCVVQQNDNYWKISKRAYGTSRYFSALALYNSKRISNPKHLRPGMKVLLPDAEVLEQKYPKLFRDSRTTRKLPTGFFVNQEGAAAYRIGERDTLSQIAQKHLGRSSRWIQIYRLNRGVLANPNKLKPGTVIVLPDDATDVHMVP